MLILHYGQGYTRVPQASLLLPLLTMKCLGSDKNAASDFTQVPAARPLFQQRQCGGEVYLMSHVICSPSGARGV